MSKFNKTIKDFFYPYPVFANCDIKDNPLSRKDNSTKKGTMGWIDDIDYSANLVFVTFNGNDGSIACDPSEIY